MSTIDGIQFCNNNWICASWPSCNVGWPGCPGVVFHFLPVLCPYLPYRDNNKTNKEERRRQDCGLFLLLRSFLGMWVFYIFPKISFLLILHISLISILLKQSLSSYYCHIPNPLCRQQGSGSVAGLCWDRAKLNPIQLYNLTKFSTTAFRYNLSFHSKCL